jgi:PAS domain S-box-containing protein
MSAGADTVRILVIDDDAVDRERVRRLVPRTGVEAVVLEEEDPAAALERVRRGESEVILLDYHFPRHDGLAVLASIQEIDALVPVIVLTGQDDVTLAVDLMKAGAVDYIPKSALTAQRLAQSLRHALRLRAADLAARAAQEALRASEEFSRRVVEASHDSIKVLDLEARVLAVSATGRRVLSVEDEAALRGRPWLELWNEDHRRAVAAAVDEARQGRVGKFVGARPGADGRTTWWDVVVTPVLGADGRAERLVAASRDVTDQRRQAEFEQQLIGIVSHDLRNPISAMMMAGQLLAQKLPADSPLRKTADRIVGSGQRASRLIHDLLDLTQVRLAGRIPVERREADIHAVCRQAVDEIAINNPDRAIVHHPQGEGRGVWDPDRMSQVVGNLTRNAISYSPAGSVVTVRSRDCGGKVRLEVHNEGRPIPADVLPTLFQPFKRGERRHDPERSIGLGLFIVREIVMAHGGSVDVSSSLAEGTTFRVDLPKA